MYLERIVEEGEFGYGKWSDSLIFFRTSREILKCNIWLTCVLHCAEEIAEILNRHNTLREANADLMQHSAQV